MSPAHPAAAGRPVWHLAAPQGWLNDPNGLVRHGGRWQACYQHHPDDDVWGPMHWGRATSTDLLHWEHQPIVLAPDQLGMPFSGSVIPDLHGVAGFGEGALLAFFTHHGHGVQQQSLAFSTDGGATFTPFADNPIIPDDRADCRDPKVWQIDDQRWAMVVTVGTHLEFHESCDLVHWAKVGEFHADLAGALGLAGVGAWECPDVVTVDGNQYLVVSLAAGGPRGRSTVMLLQGRYRGGTFEASGNPFPLDAGPDQYAFQSFAGPLPAPGGAVGMSWLASWDDALQVPSAGWRGVLSLPRRLFVIDSCLRQWPAVLPDRQEEGGARWFAARGDFEAVVHGADGEVARCGVQGGVAYLERSGGFTPTHDGRHEVRVAPSGTHCVVVDHGTVELFAAGGAASLSAQVFPGPDWNVAFREH